MSVHSPNTGLPEDRDRLFGAYKTFVDGCFYKHDAPWEQKLQASNMCPHDRYVRGIYFSFEVPFGKPRRTGGLIFNAVFKNQS